MRPNTTGTLHTGGTRAEWNHGHPMGHFHISPPVTKPNALQQRSTPLTSMATSYTQGRRTLALHLRRERTAGLGSSQAWRRIRSRPARAHTGMHLRREQRRAARTPAGSGRSHARRERRLISRGTSAIFADRQTKKLRHRMKQRPTIKTEGGSTAAASRPGGSSKSRLSRVERATCTTAARARYTTAQRVMQTTPIFPPTLPPSGGGGLGGKGGGWVGGLERAWGDEW